MVPELPDDIYHLICDTLVEHRQFGTLFNCCTANRNLAVAALTNMYKYVCLFLIDFRHLTKPQGPAYGLSQG